jgi:hypothetical protein
MLFVLSIFPFKYSYPGQEVWGELILKYVLAVYISIRLCRAKKVQGYNNKHSKL